MKARFCVKETRSQSKGSLAGQSTSSREPSLEWEKQVGRPLRDLDLKKEATPQGADAQDTVDGFMKY